VAREDYSNRTRETLHRNWLFDETDVIVSGQGEQLKDTFIYNQSWWTKNSQCHSYFYKLQTGATSGHSHAYPKDREELVLGLMNRFRNPLGERGNSEHWSVHDDDEFGQGPFECTDAWSNNPYYCEDNPGNHDWIGTDEWGQNWIDGNAQYSPSNDDRGYWCNDRPFSISYSMWIDTPNHCFEYTIQTWDSSWDGPMEQQINPWRWYSHTNLHCKMGWNDNGTNWSRASGNDDGTYQNANGGSSEYDLSGVSHVVNYEDIAICNQCLTNVGDFPTMTCNSDEDQLNAKNWMKNQPPSKERTPFRPIFLCDLRTEDNPAVPEGGFIRTAKLILTVSQQSIAWPRQGFTAEIYNLAGSSTTEDANWWSYKGTNDMFLGHDAAGNTMGDWYTETDRGVNQMSNLAWDTTKWWLPDPIHKTLVPKDNPLWTWGLKEENSHRYQTFLDPPLYRYAPMMTEMAWDGKGYLDDPHYRACRDTGRTEYDHETSPVEKGGYYNQQLLISPAYDGETSFTTKDVNGMPNGFDNCVDYPLWSPRSWREDASGFSNVFVEDRGCSAGNWHGRASEVEGLTGCGGCIEILPYGSFLRGTIDICIIGPAACDFHTGGSYRSEGHFAGDGYYYDYAGDRITEWNTDINVPEWTPIKKQNYKTFQIPKFTNAGYSAGWWDVTHPGFGIGYATGGSGSYDGRGITFTIEVDDFARHAIANKDQKLHLIMKGEYKNNPYGEAFGGTNDMEYESAGILYLVAGHTGCRDCLDVVQPGEVGNDNSNGTYAQTKDWRTDAAQLATNFFSVDSPAPDRIIPVNFQGKGSTLDWPSGDIGNITYGLQTAANPYKEEYIYLAKPGFDPTHMFDRFNNVFDKLISTDKFEIVGSGDLCASGNGNCDGTSYRAYKTEYNSNFTKIYVTGDARLFDGCPLDETPETFVGQEAKFIGTHKIIFDGEYYIETNADSGLFENFYDDVEEQSDHSGQKAYPEFYSATEAMLENGHGGITGGGKDFLEFNINSDYTHSNNGTYNVIEAYFRNDALGINIERLKVKEKVTHLVEESCLVKRVNHRPRLDITYRSRHQYDATTSGGLHDP